MLKSTAKSEIVINDLNSIRSHQILNGYGQLWLLWLWHICVKHSTVCLTFGPSFWLPSVYLPRCGDKMWQDVFECLVVTNCKTLYTSLYLNIHQQFESVWFLWCSIDFHFVLLVLFFDSTVFCRSGSRAKNSSIFHHPCVSYILKMIEHDRRWDQSTSMHFEDPRHRRKHRDRPPQGRSSCCPCQSCSTSLLKAAFVDHLLHCDQHLTFFRKDARHWNKKLVRCLATPVECFDCFQCLSCTPESWRHWMSLGSHWHVGTTSTIVDVKWCKCVQVKSCMQWVRIGSCMQSALILFFPLAFGPLDWRFGQNSDVKAYLKAQML